MIMELFSSAGQDAVSSVIQWAAGILLSLPVYRYSRKHAGQHGGKPLITALLSSLAGLLLPMGTLGVLPLYIALLAAGSPAIALWPLLCSNFVFNMLMPLTEMNFRWDLSYLRILAAFLVGIGSYFAASLILKKDETLVRNGFRERYAQAYQNAGWTGILSLHINETGLFLILGLLLNALRGYYMTDAMGAFLVTDTGSIVKDFLLVRNASNSLFFTNPAMIFNTVLYLTAPAVLLSFLKLRGVLLLYVTTGLVCAFMLTGILF